MDEHLSRLVQLLEYDLVVREQRILKRQTDSSKVPEDLVAMTDRIKQIRDGIPASVLAKYDRFAGVGKVPVVKVVNGMCQGCLFKLPTGLAMEIKANSGIHDCPNCGRFLYS